MSIDRRMLIASSRLAAPTAPFPAASPEAFTHSRCSGSDSTHAAASSNELNERPRAVGMPCRSMNAFAHALLASMRAAAAEGP
ncbi:hypothetical protein O0235_00955 [Tepidiforma flava]|uniref:Secreted protein n=1 Tax=Tepidiforma flava TaxID=3004094 RepID=A0ABY7M6Q3_9CHLR|nr:hypothetical protein [Tepidiforma flava]WBL36215.1 hypothetical protein O0235_00955 [Tepidiforma flava]